MKKILFAVLSFALFSSCFVNAKTLIAYYSYTGNCKAIATELQSQITADIIEIQPAEEGVDYAANNYKIGDELISAIKDNPSSESSYPAIKEITTNLSQYSIFIIVTPLWWSQMAAPMQTFLFKNASALAGKDIGLIVSSYSSGISGVESDAKRLLPNSKFMSEPLWINNSKFSQKQSLIESWLKTINYSTLENGMEMQTKITIGSATFTADIEDTETGRAFMNTLPMTLDMKELNGNEKYHYLLNDLPNNDQYFSSLSAGDLMLYSGSCVVLFYGNAGGYNYTRIGKLTSTEGLTNAVGKGNVSVKFEQSTSAVNSVKADIADHADGIYDLYGRRLSDSPNHGIYIENGIKRTK